MFKPWQVIVFLLVVVLAVVGFIFWYYSAPSTGATAADANTQPAAAAPTDANAGAQTLAASAGVSTDAALDADLNAVDAQLQTVNADSASVEQSLNDQPVTQTE